MFAAAGTTAAAIAVVVEACRGRNPDSGVEVICASRASISFEIGHRQCHFLVDQSAISCCTRTYMYIHRYLLACRRFAVVVIAVVHLKDSTR